MHMLYKWENKIIYVSYNCVQRALPNGNGGTETMHIDAFFEVPFVYHN